MPKEPKPKDPNANPFSDHHHKDEDPGKQPTADVQHEGVDYFYDDPDGRKLAVYRTMLLNKQEQEAETYKQVMREAALAKRAGEIIASGGKVTPELLEEIRRISESQ